MEKGLCPHQGQLATPDPDGPSPRQLPTLHRMPGLTGGRWRSGSQGEPEGCTRRETGGIEPGRLPLADQPAAYLTRTGASTSDRLIPLRNDSPVRESDGETSSAGSFMSTSAARRDSYQSS